MGGVRPNSWPTMRTVITPGGSEQKHWCFVDQILDPFLSSPTKDVSYVQCVLCFVLVLSCRIRFTVVSEPPEEVEDGDCEDVGVAFVNVRHILHEGRDVIDQDVPSE